MRTWPALVVGRLKQAPTTEEYVGADFSRPDIGDLLQAALLDFDVVAIEETSADSWRVFFSTQAARAAAASALLKQFPDLTITSIDVDDEDWAARSQASLRAVTVGGLVIAPPWDVPAAQGRLKPAPTIVGAGFSRPITVVILPSMGFGTGHHATTRLCLAALQQIDMAGGSVIDVGTGSGVLAIAASLLGAATIRGIDDDPDAIQAATDNLALNPEARVTFEVVDLRATTLAPAALVLANLTGGLLVSAAGRLQELVLPGGHLVLSGFMAHEERDVLQAFGGDALEQRGQEDEWLCVTLQRSR